MSQPLIPCINRCTCDDRGIVADSVLDEDTGKWVAKDRICRACTRTQCLDCEIGEGC